MSGPTGHYAKWKSDRERQTQYDLTYMWNLKEKNKKRNKTQAQICIHTEDRLLVARNRGWGGWNGEVGQNKTSPEDVQYSTVTTVSNSVLCIWKLLKE